MLNKKMTRKPTHPGEILLHDFLPDTGMTVTAFANHLGFSRETISRIMNGRQPITFNLAHRLEEAGVSTARMWLALQFDYDLWEGEKNYEKIGIKPIYFKTENERKL